MGISLLLPNAREGNVFTGVCQLFCSQSGSCLLGHCSSLLRRVGTHPTGMLTCFSMNFMKKRQIFTYLLDFEDVSNKKIPKSIFLHLPDLAELGKNFLLTKTRIAPSLEENTQWSIAGFLRMLKKTKKQMMDVVLVHLIVRYYDGNDFYWNLQGQFKLCVKNEKRKLTSSKCHNGKISWRNFGSQCLVLKCSNFWNVICR